MLTPILITLAAYDLTEEQLTNARMLRHYVVADIGRVGNYGSDLSVVMTNFGEVAHIRFDGDELKVYFLDGAGSSILGQVFDYVRAGSTDDRTLLIRERVVVPSTCTELSDAVSSLNAEFEKSLQWLPYEADYEVRVNEDGLSLISVDGAFYEVGGRMKGGRAVIQPDSGNQTPLYEATHQFFIVVRDCANSGPADRTFKHDF